MAMSILQLPPGFDPCTAPAATFPAGRSPNLVDPVSLAPVLIGVSATTLFLAVTLTAGRLYISFGGFKPADCMHRSQIYNADIKRSRSGSHCHGSSAAYAGVILSSRPVYLGTWVSSLTTAVHKYFRHQWDVPVYWLNASYFKV